jgi:hypothetical protein
MLLNGLLAGQDLPIQEGNQRFQAANHRGGVHTGCQPVDFLLASGLQIIQVTDQACRSVKLAGGGVQSAGFSFWQYSAMS